jgi:hypothetical protein
MNRPYPAPIDCSAARRGIAMAIGAVKSLLAGFVSLASMAIFLPGAVLLLFGITAPGRLTPLHRLWSWLGVVIAQIVNRSRWSCCSI